MTYSISGKTAIVTGAANGVGLAIARHFLDRGANVMCADIDEERLSAELGPLKDEGPLRWFAGDLCQKLTVNNLVSATVDAFDRIDILVNASRKVIFSDPETTESEDLHDVLRQNLYPGIRLSQMVAKRMISQANPEDGMAGTIGTIINLSTVAGQRTRPELMAYSIAMAAIDQATRSLAVAYAPQRIRVNGVSFGGVMSRSLQNMLKDNEDWRDAILAATPLGRIAPASELAETVQFLASEASGFMTGQIITVDGGRTLIDAASVPAH